MASLKIKKGDSVIVLTGRDKGKRGEVIEVRPKENRALVRGVNVVRTPSAPDAAAGRRHHLEGGRRSRFPTSRSRIPRTASRPASASSFLDDGKKVRFAKRSGEIIPEKK